MSPAWDDGAPPPGVRLGPGGWLRALVRGAGVLVTVTGGLLLTLLVRLVERPLNGDHRPWTPAITVAVCRISLAIIGLPVAVDGTPMAGPGAVVANHASWLDIFVLNARKRVYFVAKAEVRGWPMIGWLARATGTVFIRRAPGEAHRQTRIFLDRLKAGHRLLFFPEGTSTDSIRVLRFKSTLFQAFFSPELEPDLLVQPVTVGYRAPDGSDPRLYGWWGEMSLAGHLVQVLGLRRQGRVTLTYHRPLKVRDFADRKALARACEEAVRSALPVPA